MSQSSGVEICIERLFDASPPLLFDAMTIPQHVRHWWECLDDKHSVTVCAIDLRVGAPGDLWDVARLATLRRYMARTPKLRDPAC